MTDKKNKTAAPAEASAGCCCSDASRRKFLTDVTTGVGVVGAACTAYPFIKSMSPSADVLAQSTTEVDLSQIAEGETKTVMWRGRPVFVRHRTAAEIAESKADDGSTELLDPAADAERVQQEQWLVVMAVCTHLGCVPLEVSEGDTWLHCPCHGSKFDVAGRLRRGPAARNLDIPPYTFVDANTIKIG